ncbi:MAG: TonB family protein [Flammeovirgaceae bacterium]|nr:TonB family protein [Flammeovirgaceae bacterium]
MEDKTPLPGVNVMVKGTTTGTVTDINGSYVVDFTTNISTLVFSFIGLQTLEVTPTSSELNVQMNLDIAQLSEVVVVGYGMEEQKTNPTIEMAEPHGGRKAFNKYLEDNLIYPAEAIENKITGKVTVEFLVKSNGELTGFTVVRGIGNGCDDELIRVIKNGPSWTPSKRNNVIQEEK